jgi:hypothetical protein
MSRGADVDGLDEPARGEDDPAGDSLQERFRL